MACPVADHLGICEVRKNIGTVSGGETIADKIRHAHQGIEAVKLQRGRNEITVRVRLAGDERNCETAFENYVINAPNGEIMLRDGVQINKGRAYTVISRSNGRREIEVAANVAPQSMAENIIRDMKQEILPSLVSRYPGLSYDFKGKQAHIKESMTALFKGLGLALFCVFALLAIPFKNYFQPLIIMVCIPFGIIGAGRPGLGPSLKNRNAGDDNEPHCLHANLKTPAPIF